MPGEELYNANLPIYLQIMEQVKHRMASGQWAAGEKIPSVRELALEFGVNPNTVQRALSELERENLLYSERTSGRFVTSDASRIEHMRAQMAKELTSGFIGQMERLGYERERILDEVKKALSSSAGQE